jgi:parallel beta-helix repeat protein
MGLAKIMPKGKVKVEKIGKIGIPVFFIFFMFMLSIAGALGVAAASTIVVNGTCVKGDYYCDTIQEAVDMAVDGDEIVVCLGTYRENINITKSISLKSHSESSNTIIEAKNITDDVITVTANKVAISGFTIRNSEANGIYLDAVEGCNLSGNNIYSTRYGTHLLSSDGNTISHNMVNLNDNSGIFLESSNDNLILNNTANSNKQYQGISLRSSNYNIIDMNNASDNMKTGIMLLESNNNTIKNNKINNNFADGIYIATFSHHGTIRYIYDDYVRFLYQIMYIISSKGANNTILNNTICNNKDDGIHLRYAVNNMITGNKIYGNKGKDVYLAYSQRNTIVYNWIDELCWLEWSSNFNNVSNNGIYNSLYLQPSTYPVPDFRITGNIISKNDIRGKLSLRFSLKNEIYLNSMDNVSTSLSYSSDIWNSTSKMAYTYNGKRYTNYMGNYWTDYEGMDADGDGIGDTPHSIDSDKDRCPLMEPWANYTIESPPPVEDFTYTPEKFVVNEINTTEPIVACVHSPSKYGQAYPKKEGGLCHE